MSFLLVQKINKKKRIIDLKYQTISYRITYKKKKTEHIYFWSFAVVLIATKIIVSFLLDKLKCRFSRHKFGLIEQVSDRQSLALL
jgi:hypothetical protein